MVVANTHYLCVGTCWVP